VGGVALNLPDPFAVWLAIIRSVRTDKGMAHY
jgi:hypothetical protein